MKKFANADDLNRLTGNFVEVVNGDVDRALSKLKNKLKRDNWIIELRKHEFYIKPSEKKRTDYHKSKRRGNEEN